MTAINGEFYIDNLDDAFYLRETNEWDYKGKLAKANIVGFLGDGPFLPGERFQLATSETAVVYFQEFSEQYSSVESAYPVQGDRELLFTDNLAAALAYGDRVICRAHIAAGERIATLTFANMVVAPHAQLYLVMPDPADATLAGVQALFGGGLI